MKWIVNLLLNIISFIWTLWVGIFGRIETESPLLRWFLKCWDAKDRSGGIVWNEFLALMKFLTLHYIQHHDEAEKYRNYTEYVDMTPFKYRGYSEDDWDDLVNQIYFNGSSKNTQNSKPAKKQGKAKEKRAQKKEDVPDMMYEEASMKQSAPTYEPSHNPPSQLEQQKEGMEYSFGEKVMSMAWLWVVLLGLIVGGAIWYMFDSDSQEPELPETPIEKATTNEPKVIDVEKENEEKQAFVKEFYMHYLDESYLRDNVTEDALKKLRRDYPYECEDDDCLATWVFSAYPSGTDLELEEGPIIKGENSPFRVYFKYSYMSNGRKCYEERSVRIWVKKDGSRYKVFSYDYDDKTQAPRHEEEKIISEIPEGKYNLSCADMHVILNVHDSEVEGEYYFHGGSYMSTSVKLYGRADNGLQLHLRQWNAINEEDLGYMDGTFDGKTFKGEYDKEGYRVQFEVFVNE